MVKGKGALSRAKLEVRPGPWLGPVDSLVLVYQAVMSLVVATVRLPWEQKGSLLEFHGFFSLALVVLLWNLRGYSGPLVRFLKAFYPLAVMLFFYREVGALVHGYFDWTLDEWLLGVDAGIGRIGTSVWNFQQFYPPSRILNEFFSIGYSFFFFLTPLAALVLYFKAPLERFRTFMFTLVFTYFLHYLLFILLPAESPRFFLPGLQESLKGYWVSDWLQERVRNNAFAGGSFPSSHIAASVICFMAYPWLGRWRFPVFFLTLAMFAGTLYGRYHYFIDIVAGLGVGLGCYAAVPWIERRWPLVFDEEGIVRGRLRQEPHRG